MLCYSNYLGTYGPLCIVEQVNGHLENTAYRPRTGDLEHVAPRFKLGMGNIDQVNALFISIPWKRRRHAYISHGVSHREVAGDHAITTIRMYNVVPFQIHNGNHSLPILLRCWVA